ncbi:MAG: hypothetical protein ACI4O9_00570 [Akkermansia sp.]
MRCCSLLVSLLLLGGFPLPAEDDTVVDAGDGGRPTWLTGEQEDEDAAAIRATRDFDSRRDEEVRRAQEEVRRRDAAHRAAQAETRRRAAAGQPRPKAPALPRPAAGQTRSAAASGTPILLPDADEHVLSQSGFFSISGADSLRLGAIATHADEVRGRVLALLGLAPDVRCMVSIRLLGKSTDTPQPHPIRTRIRILDGQPNFQIRIYPGGGIDLQALDRAIVAVVLCERALRALEPGAIPDAVSLPDWLVTGLYQAVAWRSNKAVDRELYRHLFDRAEMLSPEEIVSLEHPEQLDAVTRQVYNASCGVLVMALLTRDGGVEQLRSLLDEAATAEGSPRELIAAHFHELGVDRELLSKWWALELANLALPQAQEVLTPLESERELSEALTAMYFDPETETPRPLSVDNVYELTAQPHWQSLLRPCLDRLMQLSLRCFPGYRPIVAEYCRVVTDVLSGGSPDEAQNSLGPLRELRQAYVAACLRGRDYLDWYEITHLGKENRRSFDNYAEAMRLLRRETPSAPTPISDYLDDIEALYLQKEGEPLPDRLLNQVPIRARR